MVAYRNPRLVQGGLAETHHRNMGTHLVKTAVMPGGGSEVAETHGRGEGEDEE
jgi:hypothetical protein